MDNADGKDKANEMASVLQNFRTNLFERNPHGPTDHQRPRPVY
jgi:hypothetical protein